MRIASVIFSLVLISCAVAAPPEVPVVDGTTPPPLRQRLADFGQNVKQGAINQINSGKEAWKKSSEKVQNFAKANPGTVALAKGAAAASLAAATVGSLISLGVQNSKQQKEINALKNPPNLPYHLPEETAEFDNGPENIQ
jgi:hypothetical protein